MPRQPEHCRHKIFNADWIIDGVTEAKSLFGMIRDTHNKTPQGTIVAYSDNAAIMEGWRTPRRTRRTRTQRRPATITLVVANTGDRPIQVGSHYHFYETNAGLSFDREAARGFRLDIAAGTAVRFEPGQTRTVQLVALAGERKVCRSLPWPGSGGAMSTKITRQAYAEMFGPTTGDRLRLADTELIIEVEQDYTIYGEEVKFGGGKVIRDGMGQSQRVSAETVDTVITNALIVDAVTGIVKAEASA